MRYIGIDLAWAGRNPTGLAVLDERGSLLDVETTRDDEQIDAWLRPHAADDCVVAVDAPLVVRNRSGQRRCERLVTRHFGGYGAGAHPSNTSRPWFAGGSRAERLARRHHLDVDPAARSRRRVVEVYPHPAIVMLFGLTRTIPYKNKPGRTLWSLRREQGRLVDLLESLRSADPPLVLDHPKWHRLRQDVPRARTKAALRRSEDQVDAVVCAYVALLADRQPERVRVLGDVDTGYILTPVTQELATRIDGDDG